MEGRGEARECLPPGYRRRISLDLIVDEDEETVGEGENHQVTLKETECQEHQKLLPEGPELGS